MRSLIVLWLALSVLACIASSPVSIPLSPEALQSLRERGELERTVALLKDAHRRGLNQPTPQALAALKERGVTGQRSAVVILVDFEDNVADTARYPQSHYQEMLFSLDTYPSGSMRDYYRENSYEQLDLTGVVAGWYRAPETYEYYVNNSHGFSTYPRNAQRLTEDAVLAADPDVDFSQFDNDGPDGVPNSGDDDGFVDALFVVHAGLGAESTQNPAHIWSHMWVTHQHVIVDGVRVHAYSMEPENGRVGVFSHELGHVFGLPDLYDYDYDSDGAGWWSIMAAGSWANGGRTPVHFDAWCKTRLGWITPLEPVEDVGRVTLPRVEDSPAIYKLWTDGLATNMYFLVENRQQVKFDRYLLGSGLMIYHVDDAAWNNDDQWYPGHTEFGHYKVAVEQADGDFDLERGRGADGGDPWPGATNNTAFDKVSLPNSNDYDGNFTHVAVEDISPSDSLMWATIKVEPPVEYVDHALDDSQGGDGDGLAESGETVEVTVTLINYGPPISQLEVRLRTDDPEVFVSDSVSLFPPILQDSTKANDADPFSVRVADSASVHYALLTVDMLIDGGADFKTDDFEILVEHPAYLLVDDDGGEDLERYFKDALESVAKPSLVWDRDLGPLSASFLQEYHVVVWLTGDDSTSTLTEEDQDNLRGYLDGGGGLFITGQGIGYDLIQDGTEEDSDFYENYLGAHYLSNSSGCDALRGVPEDPISGAFTTSLLVISGEDGANNQRSPSVIAPAQGAVTIFNYLWGPFGTERDSTGAALCREDSGRVVYFAFGFEGIGEPAKRAKLMDAVMEWLEVVTSVEDPGKEENLPRGCRLAQNVPNPFNPATEIAYGLPTSCQVNLTVYNLLGQKVKTLVDETQPPGHHRAIWNGRDDRGRQVSSGIYLYRLKAGAYVAAGKAVLLR